MIKEHFKIKSVTAKEDLIATFRKGDEAIIPTSDLTMEYKGDIIQFEFVRPEEEEFEFKPLIIGDGFFDLEIVQGNIMPVRTILRKERLLESFSNTETILKEFNNFYSRLEVYDELGLEKRRGLLMYGPPGTGKTKSIITAINRMNDEAEEKDLCVINWKSDQIDAGTMMTFFSKILSFKENVKRLLIIVEDIGTSHDGGREMVRRVDSSLLNFLDGVGINFKVPTFIVATTNHPENLTDSLLNRPGRFDEWIEVGYPSAEERIELAEFIGKAELTDDDKKELSHKDTNQMTASHIKELIIRAKRDGVSLGEAIKKMQEHQKKFHMLKTGKSNVGFGF